MERLSIPSTPISQSAAPVTPAAGTDPGGLVTVVSGVFPATLPVANMTVAQIREQLAQRLAIDPNSQAALDGVLVASEATAVAREGQLLQFVRKAGEKGCTRCHHSRAWVHERSEALR